MKKPYIVCHMTMSLDGKVAGDFLNHPISHTLSEEYYRIHRNFNSQGFICGRVTMEGSFTGGYQVDLSKYQNINIDRKDYIVRKADFYAVAFDSSGKLGWQDCIIHDEDSGYDNSYIIEVLSENVSDAYLAYLQEIGISYIFAGKQQIDVKVALNKLVTYFDIKHILLEGGGIINAAFLNADAIDELSLILVPVTDCSKDSRSLFEGYEIPTKSFQLKASSPLPYNGLYLQYVKNK